MADTRASLSPFDRIEISRWHEIARTAGYDRIVIHDRDEGDAQEIGNFLSVYQRGDAWSRWGFVRSGSIVRAWCCLSGADIGEFDSLGEAFAAVLMGGIVERTPDTIRLATNGYRDAAIMPFPSQRKECGHSLGSAA